MTQIAGKSADKTQFSLIIFSQTYYNNVTPNNTIARIIDILQKQKAAGSSKVKSKTHPK